MCLQCIISTNRLNANLWKGFEILKKLVFIASLLGIQHLRDNLEIMPASLLVVSMGKALNVMLLLMSGKKNSW